jgi:hypothetical protein
MSAFDEVPDPRASNPTYRIRKEARKDVFDYIEMFYNPKRKHTRNRILSLVEFERRQKMRCDCV